MPDPFIMGKGAAWVLAVFLAVAGAAQMVGAYTDFNITGSTVITEADSTALDTVWALSFILGAVGSSASFWRRLDTDVADIVEGAGLACVVIGMAAYLLLLADRGMGGVLLWAFALASFVNFAGRALFVLWRARRYYKATH